MSGGDACGAGSSSCGRWLLEALVEGGACYLLEPSSGRVFSDPPEGQWPRPVGASGMLGCAVVCWAVLTAARPRSAATNKRAGLIHTTSQTSAIGGPACMSVTTVICASCCCLTHRHEAP